MDVKIYDKLAKKYDLATKIVSFGIEELWRWIFVKNIKRLIKNGSLIDVASATGEMAKALDFDEMYLIEPSSEMNKIACEKLKNKYEKCKIKELPNSEYQVPSWEISCEGKKIVIIEDTAENFKINKKVDLITAFMAIRNFDDIKKGIKNLDEHLKDGGYFAIVEMVKNDSLLAKLILWYMNNVVPLIAGLLVGMKEEYKLLGKSINSLTEEDILKHFDNYTIVKKKKLIFPIATMIIMRKNERKNS
jgi:ubiquinone/menaquinone biosynthesis C-methylase UbiE